MLAELAFQEIMETLALRDNREMLESADSQGCRGCSDRRDPREMQAQLESRDRKDHVV